MSKKEDEQIKRLEAKLDRCIEMATAAREMLEDMVEQKARVDPSFAAKLVEERLAKPSKRRK